MAVEPSDPVFHSYDLTLTDQALEDFLSFMEHQTTGSFTDTIPQLPDVAADFPGLQLQPHSGSPATSSQGSESMGVDAPMVHFPKRTSNGSAGLQTKAASGSQQQQHLGNDLATVPAVNTLWPAAQTTAVKAEPQALAGSQPLTTQAASGDCASAPLVTSPAAFDASNHMFSAQMPPATAAMGQWSAPAGSLGQQQVQQQFQHMMLAQAPRITQQPQQQQEHQQQHSTQLHAHGHGLGMQHAAAGGSMPPLVKQQTATAAASSGAAARGATSRADPGGGKGQVSHSTVEKQRRDRLNSLIDELSDIVPPADPKYSAEASSSVRRPKHVVLSDTINLLKAMQTKLQVEEAEMATLKQQAAAVQALVAQQQHQHQQGWPAAAAGGKSADSGVQHAPSGSLLARSLSASEGGGHEAGSAGLPLLPVAPESAVASTGVLVEAGLSCLYVKVNCKDRKGLLSDVVSALKALPVLISSAAITTTKDGKVHDVFEVCVEDESVSAEDIQCAVHLALFTSDKVRGKRLRQGEEL